MFATALLALFTQSFKPADLGKEVLSAGTRLDLVLRSSIDSETANQGNMIDFEVRTRITSTNGKVLVPEGAYAQGRIIKVVRTSESTKVEGYLELEAISVRASDGSRVTIRSSTLNARGNCRTNCDAVIESGAALTATIQEDYLINAN